MPPATLIGHCAERLWAAGALDVTLLPIQMKKGRPGVSISVQAMPADADKLESILFRETPTLGVRRMPVMRTVLARERHDVETTWGRVDGKIAYLPDGTPRFTPEYEACRQIAVDRGVGLMEVMHGAIEAFRSEQKP